MEARARRLVRGARRLLAGRPGLRVVYHPGYRLPQNPIADPRRAEKILGYLSAEGWLGRRGDVLVPPTVSLSQLRRAHDLSYLESLDDPEVLGRILGVESFTALEAREVLDAQRWATSGTVHAARIARGRELRGGTAVSLGGGFHHAGPARGAGFCALNDVAVAIGELREMGFSGRVLVVDLDLHHGDGTRACFARDSTVFTFSMHAASWDDSPAEATLDVPLGPAIGDETYLDALELYLPIAFARARPDFCFYVAGVDVARDDRLGSYRLSADGILRRDRMVFHHIGDRPRVVVLAGGYGPDAWRYSARMLAWLAGRAEAPIDSGAEASLARFREISGSLDRGELTDDGGADEISITAEDVYGDLVLKEQSHKLLGFYTSYGVELAFERYGLFEHLARRGYPHPVVHMHQHRGLGQSLTVYGDASRREVLIELTIEEQTDHPPWRFLFVHWLLLQDPRAQPGPDRPLLPGQHHPGLGCLRLMVGMLAMACERLSYDGLAFVPAHYHVAAQARGLLRFVDPIDEARFQTMHEALGGLPLERATQIVEEGRLRDARTGATVQWIPTLMAIPTSARLTEHFDGVDYSRQVEEAARTAALEVLEAGRGTS
jgi:acetoin utilization deacetylase AcuC-like enzyme